MTLCIKNFFVTLSINDTQHMRRSVLQNCHYADCNEAECRVLFIAVNYSCEAFIMLSVIILNVIMLFVVARCLHLSAAIAQV